MSTSTVERNQPSTNAQNNSQVSKIRRRYWICLAAVGVFSLLWPPIYSLVVEPIAYEKFGVTDRRTQEIYYLLGFERYNVQTVPGIGESSLAFEVEHNGETTTENLGFSIAGGDDFTLFVKRDVQNKNFACCVISKGSRRMQMGPLSVKFGPMRLHSSVPVSPPDGYTVMTRSGGKLQSGDYIMRAGKDGVGPGKADWEMRFVLVECQPDPA